MQKVLNAVLNL